MCDGISAINLIQNIFNHDCPQSVQIKVNERKEDIFKVIVQQIRVFLMLMKVPWFALKRLLKFGNSKSFNYGKPSGTMVSKTHRVCDLTLIVFLFHILKFALNSKNKPFINFRSPAGFMKKRVSKIC